MCWKLVVFLKSSLKIYFFGIGKNVLCKEGWKGDWEVEILEVFIEVVIELVYEWVVKVDLVCWLLVKIGEFCWELLELVYLKGYVMEVVVKELGIINEGMVRKWKFDCLKKMCLLLEEDR